MSSNPKGRRARTSLYRVGDLARAASVTRQTIYSWLKAGVIRSSYEVGGAPLFTQAEMEQAKRVARERKAKVNSLRLS